MKISNLKLGICNKILNTNMKNIIIFMIPIISHCFFFMHCRSAEECDKIWSNTLFYLQFCLACMFTAGLFQIAMVIMTYTY